ncbi:MAG: glycosyltransferase family 4 protein, partial [Firmicutes bacterium]|nr:glycosyltransferase family 4 protein [Bacillota bacterium]
PRQNANYYQVGVIARLEPEKGHRYFLQAATTILSEINNVIFLIIGTGSLEKELKDYTRELGITDRVIFTGLRDDIPELLAQMSVVVLPSLNEALSLSLIESMCLGKPCVASNVGGIKELIEDGKNGLLVKPGDPNELAQKIIFLLKHPGLAQKLGKKAARTVEEKFDARIMAKKITELYRNCAFG